MVEMKVPILITEGVTKGVTSLSERREESGRRELAFGQPARGETLGALASLGFALSSSRLQRVSSRRVCERPSLTQYQPSPSHPTQDGTCLLPY